MSTRIPFLDLVSPHIELEAELLQVFRSALASASFIAGPVVEAFESEFAEFCGTRYCVGVNSGTDALRFALIAAGVRPGEVVITVPNTFIATTEAISQAGAFPEFVDIDERTYNMDPLSLQEYLETQCDTDPTTGHLLSRRSGRQVTGIIPVHLYGQVADMDPIMELAERFRLILIEDACQAHGAEYFSQKTQSWRRAGTMGRAAAFSFYPGKNLGACGDAGAATTDDEAIAKAVRILRDHGQSAKYYHDVEGYNGRLDAIQAGILKLKLAHLTKWNQQRHDCADRYQEFLSSLSGSVTLPDEPSSMRSVYHLFVIRTGERDSFRQHMAAWNIDTAIHYPVPLHLQRAYGELGYKAGDFPVSEKVAREIVSLPMFPHLLLEQQRRVAEAIGEFCECQRSLIALAS